MARDKAAGNEKMKRKLYEKELRKLQVELCHLQDWVKAKGLRVIVLFEGRDAAGKGGTIKAITERVSPRVFRVVALPAPSDREKTQMYVQRQNNASDFPGGQFILLMLALVKPPAARELGPAVGRWMTSALGSTVEASARAAKDGAVREVVEIEVGDVVSG